MTEKELEQLAQKLKTCPFVLSYVDKGDKGEQNAIFGFASNKLDGPSLAYMHSLIGMHLMQGVMGATNVPSAKIPKASE
jgi:hypothetical protein